MSNALSKRDWVLAAVVLMLGLLFLLEPWLTRGQRGRPIPSMHTSGPAGARALALWLSDLGYTVRSTEYRPFALSPTDRLLLQLDPTDNPSEAAVDAIAAWVERGGTLLLSARGPNRLTERLGLGVVSQTTSLAEAVPLQPVFQAPPVRRVAVRAPGPDGARAAPASETAAGLILRDPGWTPLLGDPADDGRVVAATARRGGGRVYALATAHPLSNAGLAELDDAALALRLLSDLPPGATVVFDEYHHGLTEHGTLGARLVSEPWGWAALYGAGLTFAYLALAGRRFGPVAPELVWPRPRPTGQFHLKKGPIFTSILLADEVNRAPPKTQAALLEAMEERQVTLDGRGHRLPDPFMVIATQNPIEYEGTYPLPEAQLDRFLFKATVDHGPFEAEEALLARYQSGFDARAFDEVPIEPVLDRDRLAALRDESRRVGVDATILRYITQLVRASRDLADVQLGASPRAAIALLQGSRATAALEGRDYVLPDDVKRLAGPALRHRLMLKPEAELDGLTPDLVVERLLGAVEVPR